MKQDTILERLRDGNEINEVQKDSLYNLLAKGARQATKSKLGNRIYHNFFLIPKEGIIGRLHIEGDKVSYCAGQEYISELAFVRRLVIK